MLLLLGGALLLLGGRARGAEPAKDAPPAQPPEAEAPQAPPPPEAPKRVIFIPETVKAELREEIRKEVLEQAKRENWAAPDAIPGWVKRLKLSGDVRARFERDLFPRGNANQGEFPDFNAINTGKPFDVNFLDVSNERYLNVDQNRTRPRLRARLGVDAEFVPGVSAGVRLASGESSSPGSENQTLGQSGGLFSKYQVWFDRAWVGYQQRAASGLGFGVRLGRFENPFFNTELLWSPDVNFDGAAIEGRAEMGKGFAPFAVAGAFPLYTSAFAFPPERTSKFPSYNKWLFAVQLGADWKPSDGFRLKIGASFFDFDKVEGRFSSACDTNLSSTSCDTDESRPSYAQKGNTYLALRTPSAAALLAESSGAAPRYQFFGIASRFRELVATARMEVRLAPAAQVELEGEYVNNRGFKRGEIEGSALNNRGAVGPGEVIGRFRGGNIGALGRAGVGSPSQGLQGNWKVRVGYRYLESDAVLDALNDQDFGLGGTNLKGYTIDASIWVLDGISLGVRWFSADQIVGPTYAVDVFQADLYARF